MAIAAMSMVYVLTTPIPEDGGDDPTVEQVRKRNKWDNDDYVCRGLILKDFKHTLKHKKEELTLVELGSHLRIEESLGAMQDMSKDGLIPAFDMDTKKCKNCMLNKITKKPFQNVKLKTEVLELIHNDLCDLHATRSLGNKKDFMTFIDDASRDAIFDDNRFTSVPRPSLRIPNGTKDIGTRDEVSDQHSYCFNAEEDPKTFDEAMKSQDVAFRKEAINDEMDSIMGNNTWVLADLPSAARISTIRLLIAMASIHNLIIHQMDVKTAFLNSDLDEEVNLIKEFLTSKLFMKDMGETDVILVSTPIYTSEKLMLNNGQAVSRLEYSRVIGCLMYAMICTRHDIAFVVGKLSRYTSNHGTQHWQAIQRISNTKDNSSTSGWVFLLGGGAISWVFKKQTCITSSTMESEFMALAAAGKEAEWLKNLHFEIPLWSKPMAPISIHCDSSATLSKAYSQMYNGKSRHLGVRHSMIHDLITNRVISIEFVRSQQNLADHLTKGLARDLVIKSAEEMGLKGLKHMYLHIIPRMCLEPVEKEDEVFTSQWGA
ncbi:zinc finger, CCHC-type containing protein [Tanacetum coccineum]